MENENHVEKRKNRKRKKTFLQNARKYAKKGTYGRGSHLNEDTYQYFVRVLEIFKDGFETEEEKIIFANNVFEQTEKEELNYSRNQIGCRVIETLLPLASPQVLVRFSEAFNPEIRPLCSDRFASHVLEALHKACCIVSVRNKPSDNESVEDITKCKDFALKLSKFLLNNIEDYVNDTYGNHIVRTVLENFSTTKDENDKLLSEYTEIVIEYANRLMAWPHFKDLPYNELTSGLLQSLLKSLEKIDEKMLRVIQKKLLNESFSVRSNENEDNEPVLPDVFSSKPATLLLEASLSIASGKTFTQIYAKCFVGNIAVLAKKRDNNFSVQKLLDACTEKTELEAIFGELNGQLEEILQCGHTGVILSLAQACKRLVCCQGQFIQQFMQALHCSEPQERQDSFVAAVSKLIPYERLSAIEQTDQKQFVHLHGSLLIQTMLQFNKPIKVINSILSMSSQQLEKLFTDVKGSRILDAYVVSQYVGEKSREKLIRKLQGTYHSLVISKFGSRSFESIWNVASLKQRTQIMQELSYKDGSWISNEFGRIIAGKVNVQLYKRNQEEWKQFIGKSEKTKDLFADIIGTS